MFKIRLKEQREKAGLSQNEFAKIIGVKQSAVGNWESGIREPNFNMLLKISDSLNVSIDYLLGNSDNPAPVDEIAAASVSNGGTYADLTPENLAAIEQVKDILRNLPELKIKKE